MTDTTSSIAQAEIKQEVIARAIVNEREEWDVCAETINRGRCIPFAEAVLERLGGETDTLFLTGCEVDGGDPMGRWGGHVWICASDLGLHFDAECPEGRSDWQTLPFYNRKKNQLDHPLGPVGVDILTRAETVSDPGLVKGIEGFWKDNAVYEFGPDMTEYGREDQADAKYTPTRWWEGSCPTIALMDLLRKTCPDRGDWRSWLNEENKIREQKGFNTYDNWFEGGIRDPVIVDGQGPFLWDGWHRVAWSISTEKKRVPVYLGTHPGPERATEITDQKA